MRKRSSEQPERSLFDPDSTALSSASPGVPAPFSSLKYRPRLCGGLKQDVGLIGRTAVGWRIGGFSGRVPIWRSSGLFSISASTLMRPPERRYSSITRHRYSASTTTHLSLEGGALALRLSCSTLPSSCFMDTLTQGCHLKKA